MPVGDKVETVILFLEFLPVVQGAVEMSQVQPP
jgi:hypothetical protein